MNNKAFTLIELLVVTSIIALLTALILPNYRAGNQSLALQRSAHKLAQDLRRAQEMALSSQEFNGEVPQGYGIYFDISDPARYVLFADLNNDQAYTVLLDGVVEDVLLEKQAEIGSLSTGSYLTVTFTPPDPIVTINPDAESATITLGQKEKQYFYKFMAKVSSHQTPRAGCDNDANAPECSSSFDALATGDEYVYDWYTEASTGYQYQWQRNVLGWSGSRASCDASPATKDCPSSFSAQAGDPSTVSDWYQETTGYQFVKTGTVWWQYKLPRATHCDKDDYIADCPSSFPDSYGYASPVYDWWEWRGMAAMSNIYDKQSILQNYSQVFSKIFFSQVNDYSNKYQKTEAASDVFMISVNAAGLIAIE